jgi:iron complex outermembrane receptor protein
MRKASLQIAVALVILPIQNTFGAADIVLEEVTVTAQRREQNLQDTPISVTAFSADFLQQSNVQSARDYLSLTPNVSFTEDAQVGNRGVSISIRGISDVKTGENTVANAIGYYLDEFSVVSVAQGTINPQMQDVERVEVLRGPQGTYFGRNSTGGALNIITKRPTDAFESELTMGASKFDGAGSTQYISGIVNIPVSATFRLRGVGTLENSSGMVKNVDPRGTPDSGYKAGSARLSARWLASDTTTVDATVMWSDQNEGIDPTVPSGVLDLDTRSTFRNPALVLPIDDGIGFYPQNINRVSHDRRESNDNKMLLANLRVTQRFSSSLTLKSITGIIATDNRRRFDQDLTSMDMLLRDNNYSGKSWSQELRLESLGDRVDWVLGALYADDSQKQFNRIYMGSERSIQGIGVLPPAAAFPAGTSRATINQSDREYGYESTAVYADATWRFTDRAAITVGGRYTHDAASQERFNVAGFGGAPLAPVRGAASFDDFSPRAVVNYKLLDHTNLYASVSKGYKSGGVTVGHISTQGNRPFVDPFDEESLWAYELGMKSEFWDRRARLNAAVFRNDWRNMQLESTFLLDPTDISSNVNSVANVEGAKLQGAEVELTLAATEGLTLIAGIGYLDSELGQGSAKITGNKTVQLGGLPAPKSPTWTANAIAEYSHPVSFGRLYLRGEWIYRGDSYSNIEGLTHEQTEQPEFPYKIAAYDVVNLRSGVELREHISLNFYVENLLNEKYHSGSQEDFGLSGIRLKPHPRVFGITFTYRTR